MNEYKTCTHTYDSGRTCASAAAKGREYCGYHLRYRGRLMRMAQFRARHQRFDIILPPLDSLCSIQSALSQVAEALAADMIDPRRAMGLLKALRFAKENLKDGLKDDNAHWHDTPYLTEDAAAYDSFESEYGLPDNLDIDTPPEVAFPDSVILSEERSDESKSRCFAGVQAGSRDPERAQRAEGDPFVSAKGIGSITHLTPPFVTRDPLFPEIPPPYVRDYTAEAEAAFCEVTPQDMELDEILKTQGYKAFERPAREHQRNQDRRKVHKLFRANYERYAAEAKTKNIQRAAEKLLAERLAAEKAAAAQAQPDQSEMKKPPLSAAADAAQSGAKEAQKTA